MKLTGELTYNAIALKMNIIEKKTKSSIILTSKKDDDENTSMDDFPDHLLQGIVIGVGKSVQESGNIEIGDTVLLKVLSDWMPKPYLLNDKGTMYSVYNDTDVILIRKKE